MINQLIQTNISRNMAPLGFFVFISALFLIIFCFANKNAISINALYLTFAFISFFLYLIIGAIVLKNDVQERRIRLFAQLPVSTSEVRISSWCFMSLCLCLPTFMWLLSLMYMSDISFLNLLHYTLLFYFHGAVLISIIFILTQYNTLLLTIEKRKLRPFVLILLTTLPLFGFFFILSGDIFIIERVKINWAMLLILFVGPCFGLVAIDIYLFKRSDNFLS